MAGGRPTDYKDEYVTLAFNYCLLGATDSDLGAFFDVDESTINNWKIAHPEFLESIKGGKQKADAEVAQKLFHRAKGYSHEAVKIFADVKGGGEMIVPYTEHYPPDTTAAIFWLKNRQPDKWREKAITEVTGKDGGAIITSGIPATDALIAAIVGARTQAIDKTPSEN